MKDRHNREIDYLRISVTDKCNLNCFYCKTNDELSNLMTDQEIIEIVKASVKQGIKKVRITGGEPLVRKGIYSLLKKIKEIEGVNELTITTNGILLIDNVDKLKDSGVDRVNISLDSLNEKDYQSITKTNKAFNYKKLLQDLMNNGFTKTKINVVLLKGINDDLIEEYINLMDKFDVTIRFIELMDIGELDYEYKEYFISSKEVLSKLKNVQFYKEEGNTIYYKINDKQGLIGFINPISNKFCESCNRIRVTSDGKIRPCLHYDAEFEINSEEVDELIKKAILSKPKEHKLKEGSKPKKAMNKIGG